MGWRGSFKALNYTDSKRPNELTTLFGGVSKKKYMGLGVQPSVIVK